MFWKKKKLEPVAQKPPVTINLIYQPYTDGFGNRQQNSEKFDCVPSYNLYLANGTKTPGTLILHYGGMDETVINLANVEKIEIKEYVDQQQDIVPSDLPF